MDEVEVGTRAGRLRGRWRSGTSAVFLGIPFARAPVGQLRFAAPVPHPSWDGVREATRHGPTPQRRHDGTTLIPEPSVPGEATLNLNVSTPSPGRGSRLPVIVFIHGGAYVSGSPASPWYGGAAFNRDGVVIVTVSYRLGFDGFGLISDAPSNRGVRDWLCALEWVQDNIADFGGDPSRVTVAGQSAGGGAVLTLLGVPRAAGLFARAIALSPFIPTADPDRARQIAVTIGRELGCRPTRGELSLCSEERLLAAQSRATAPGNPVVVLREVLTRGLPFGPLVDGELIPAPLLDGLGGDHGVPLVVGTCDDELTTTLTGLDRLLRHIPLRLALRLLPGARELGAPPGGHGSGQESGQPGHSEQSGQPGQSAHAHDRLDWLAPNAALRAEGNARVLGRYLTDRVFRRYVPDIVGHRDAPTWTYRFAWPSARTGLAMHCLDVPFFFDCLEEQGVAEVTGPNPPATLAAEVHGAAVGFATEGNPGWPAQTDARGLTRVFAAESRDEADAYASARQT